MELLKPLIALLAIVNPIGVVPFFIHFTQNLSVEARRRTIRVSAFTAFLVIALSALAGLKIIEFFGISLASFQVGGRRGRQRRGGAADDSAAHRAGDDFHDGDLR